MVTARMQILFGYVNSIQQAMITTALQCPIQLSQVCNLKLRCIRDAIDSFVKAVPGTRFLGHRASKGNGGAVSRASGRLSLPGNWRGRLTFFACTLLTCSSFGSSCSESAVSCTEATPIHGMTGRGHHMLNGGKSWTLSTGKASLHSNTNISCIIQGTGYLVHYIQDYSTKAV